MKRVKILELDNLRIRLVTSSRFLLDLISEQLNFCKPAADHKKTLNISLHLEEVSSFSDGRSDSFNTDGRHLSLESWLKNIQIDVQPDKNHIAGKIITPAALSNEAIFDLLVIHPLRHILKYKNIFLIHAAVLAKNGKGVVVCGLSKSGKSTLAIKLVENGFKFLSDEFAIFNKGDLFSFPLKIALDTHSLRVFPRLPKLIKKNYEKNPFDIRKLYPNCYTENCVPAIIVFLKPSRKHRKAIITPISRENAFYLLCMDKDNSLPFEKNLSIRQRQIQALAILAKKTRAYSLSYSLDKIDEASKIVGSLLI